MIKSKFGFLKFPAASPVLTRKPPPQVYADKRATVNLCCEADGSLVWTRAQTALTLVPSSQQNGCLTLSNVNEDSSGKYTCRASNEFGFAEATTEVIYTGCVTFLTSKKQQLPKNYYSLAFEKNNFSCVSENQKGWGGGRMGEVCEEVITELLVY